MQLHPECHCIVIAILMWYSLMLSLPSVSWHAVVAAACWCLLCCMLQQFQHFSSLENLGFPDPTRGPHFLSNGIGERYDWMRKTVEKGLSRF